MTLYPPPPGVTPARLGDLIPRQHHPTDLLDSDGDAGPTPQATSGTAKCPHCGAAFSRRRRNQTYCGRQCQRNASQGSRTCAESHAQRDTCRRVWERLSELNTRYYSTPPGARLGLLQGWLDAARDGRDPQLRAVLRRPEFCRPEKGTFTAYHRGCWAYPPVPVLADRFCMTLRGCHVWDWVSGKAPEPLSGWVADQST